MKKIGLTTIILFFLTTFLYGQTAEELKKAAEFHNQGGEFYKKDQYDKAIQSYTEYLKIRPNAANGWYNRGLAFYFNGIDLAKNTTESSKRNLNSAIADFSQAIKLDPNDKDVFLMRGKSYFWLRIDGMKFVDSALSDFSQALKIDQNFADAYYERGRAYSEKNQMENALADFNKAIQLNPNKADAYFERGKIYSAGKKTDSANADFQAALRINPNHPHAKGWIKETSQSINPTQPVTAQSWQSAFEEGKNALRQNQPDRAIAAFQKSLNLFPTKFESDQIELLLVNQKAAIQENLAKAQIAKKDYDNAINTCLAAQDLLFNTLVNKISKIEKFKLDPSMLIEISKSKLDLMIMNYDLVLSQASESAEIGKRCFNAFPQTELSAEQKINLLAVGILKAGTEDLLVDSLFTTSSVRFSLSQLCQDKGRNVCGVGSRNNEINKYAEKSLADINLAIGYGRLLKKLYLHRAAVYRHLGKADLALADETKANQLK